MFTAVDPSGLSGLGAELLDSSFELSRRATSIDDTLRSVGIADCTTASLHAMAAEMRDVHGVVRRRLLALEEEQRASAQRKGGLSGWLHGALDVVGLVPVFGEIADGANALWYLAEGDLVNASLSGMALLPIGGQLATASKYADDVVALTDDAAAVADDIGPLKSSWGRADTLDDHVLRHGPDFDVTARDEYELLASDFFVSSQRRELPTKIDAQGRIRIYDPETNTFGSYNPDGMTATFYKPDHAKYGYASNWDYWLSQKGEPPWTP